LASHSLSLSPPLPLSLADLGCGIGGPQRAISRFTGAHVIGVNNNAYQIARGTELNAQAGLAAQTSFIKGDFHHLPLEDASVDGVYTIEASCHSPDRVALYREMLRVLKPGGSFCGYEWTMTDEYDETSAEHRKIKHDILEGDGLPDIGGYSTVKLRDGGFFFFFFFFFFFCLFSIFLWRALSCFCFAFLLFHPLLSRPTCFIYFYVYICI
jgi:ubiquinone/menaquinone biosynthesis C-methylase UbiE